MRIDCPECGAALRAPAAREIECPRCGHGFRTPAGEDGGEGSAAPAAPSPARPRPSARRRRGGAMLHRFRVGEVIGTAFRAWGANLLPYLLLTFLIFLPVYALGFLVLRAESGEAAVILGMLSSFLSLVLSQLLTATVVWGVFQQLRGQRPPIGRCVSEGLSRLFPVVGVAIVESIVILLASIPFIVGVVFVDEQPAVGGPLIIAALFLVAWVVLGVLVAVPVAVVEKPGVFASIARSWELTKGLRLKMFLALFTAALVIALLGLLLGFLVRAAGEAGGLEPRTLGWLGDLAYEIPSASFWAVVAAVIYYQLRRAKEGIGVEELADVFS